MHVIEYNNGGYKTKRYAGMDQTCDNEASDVQDVQDKETTGG